MRYFFKQLIIIYLALLSSAYGIDKTGTTAAKFLSIGVGSRSAGLGNAFVAIADDPTAMYWNPAGISRLESHEAIVNHNNWFADIGLDYSGVVVKVSENSAFGFHPFQFRLLHSIKISKRGEYLYLGGYDIMVILYLN